MIILESKLLDMPLNTYALDTDGTNILNKVIVPSALACTARTEWLANLVATKQITQQHSELIAANMHTNTVKPAYIANDASIPTDQLSAAEMYDYAIAAGIEPPFARTDTVPQAIAAIKSLGYLFNRITANNI